MSDDTLDALERAVIDAAMELVTARGERRQQEAWHKLKDACAELRRARFSAPYRRFMATLMAMPEEDIDKIRRARATDEVIEKLVAMPEEKRAELFAFYRRTGDPTGIKLADTWDEAVRRAAASKEE